MVSIRFANGSEGSIHYLVNGDRAFSKERIEIFGGGGVAVLDDFRKMEMTRFGRKSTLTSRWRQDKGHHAEWQAFTIRCAQAHPRRFRSHRLWLQPWQHSALCSRASRDSQSRSILRRLCAEPHRSTISKTLLFGKVDRSSC